MDASPSACDDRPLTRSFPHNMFSGIKGLALAARFCRTQLDDGTWVGLPDVARKLEDSVRIDGQAAYTAGCPCGEVLLVPWREMVFCGCDRILLADDTDVWVFELGPQEGDDEAR